MRLVYRVKTAFLQVLLRVKKGCFIVGFYKINTQFAFKSLP